jgi:hypothetical protein
MGRRVCGVGARRRTPRRDLRRTGQRPFYRGTGKYFNRSPTPSVTTDDRPEIGSVGRARQSASEPMNVVPGPLHWRLRRGVQSRGGCVARSRGGGAQERRGRGAASRLLVAPRAVSPLPSTYPSPQDSRRRRRAEAGSLGPGSGSGSAKFHG